MPDGEHAGSAEVSTASRSDSGARYSTSLQWKQPAMRTGTPGAPPPLDLSFRVSTFHHAEHSAIHHNTSIALYKHSNPRAILSSHRYINGHAEATCCM